MLLLSQLRENPEEAAAGLSLKGVNDALNKIQAVLAYDEQRRTLMTKLEQCRAESNAAAKKIGSLMAAGNATEADQIKSGVNSLKEEIKTLETEVDRIEKEQQNSLVSLPNLPHPSVPAGKTPEDNTIVFNNQIKVQLPSNAKPHWELAKTLDIIDFELGNKITGAGFPVYKGMGARIQRALINFFLDEARNAGYTEIQPPILINADSGYGTGQLPDKEGQMYFVTEDNLYLIPTAEVPITNIYRDVIITEEDMPIQNCGYTPCFRREAGSYGKDVRGLNRLHQFDKVEIVQVTHPDNSYETLEQMSAYVQTLLQKLELPYRVVLLCGGDMSFNSAKTYDMEVWSAAQEKWLEVSSVSNFEAFQANRLKLRYKDKESKSNKLCHTLNGSALALPRILAALLENNQTAEGTIRIPKALIPYTGFEEIK
jgi:seryl-tRNA synthetase